MIRSLARPACERGETGGRASGGERRRSHDMPDMSVEEAVKQNCQAVLTGDLMRIMSDLTPEALGAVMANAGGSMGGAMPALTSFDVQSHDVNGDDHVFKIAFKGDQDFMAVATWKDVAGAWKITDLKMGE
jgi:hypothetical protein